MPDNVGMKENRQGPRDDAPRDGRVVVFCDDHDHAKLMKLVSMGGRVVGWVDGSYRVLMNCGIGR